MIKVTVEMLPFGSEKEKYTIGQIKICNLGVYGLNQADYSIHVKDDCGEQSFKVEGFNREKKIWTLLREALNMVNPVE